MPESSDMSKSLRYSQFENVNEQNECSVYEPICLIYAKGGGTYAPICLCMVHLGTNRVAFGVMRAAASFTARGHRRTLAVVSP